jgi:hypothetical protein
MPRYKGELAELLISRRDTNPWIARALGGATHIQEDPDDDIDVPEEVEGILEQLFQGLQDKVRAFPRISSALIPSMLRTR